MAIKKLACEACGGQLIIDEMKQNYTCQFCGVTYDYEYFREDDIHTKAERYLHRHEFKAAREALEFLLEKEPSNSYALEKLLLSQYHLRDAEDIVKTDVRLWHEADPEEVDRVVSGSEELTKLRELIESRMYAQELDLKVEELDSVIASEETRLLTFNDLAAGCYSGKTGERLTIDAIRKKYIRIAVVVVLCTILLLGPGILGNLDHIAWSIFLVAYVWATAALVIVLEYRREAAAFRAAEDYLKTREELVNSLEKHREERSVLQERSDSIKERLEQEVSAFIRT